jgi:hypothetical protein
MNKGVRGHLMVSRSEAKVEIQVQTRNAVQMSFGLI